MLTNFHCCVAIAGKDFCIVAADTRISSGFNILSREHSKTTRLTDKCVITSGGMVADIETLHKLLIAKVKTYERTFKKTPSIESLAQLLGNTLYGRRFMPYYAFNLLCGLDKNGEGVVFGYDAIGSWDKLTYGVQGSGSELGAPILDNQFVGHNFLRKQTAQDKQTAEETAKDIINSIAERDIYTGDGVEIVIVDSNGVHVKREAIRRD
jgi:20S proteasome subunit beta 6